MQGNGAGALAEKDGTLSRVAVGKDLVGDAACHHLDPRSDSPSSGGRCPGKAAKPYPKRSLLLLHRHFFSSPLSPAPVLFVKNRFLGAELLVGFRGAGCPARPTPAEGLLIQGQESGPVYLPALRTGSCGVNNLVSVSCPPAAPATPPPQGRRWASKSPKNWAEQGRKGGPPLLPVFSVIKKQTKHKELAKHQGHTDTSPMQNLYRARTLSQNLDSAHAHSCV